MKSILILIIAFLSHGALGATADVLCERIPGKRFSLMSDKATWCMGELFAGNVCFTGDRRGVVRFLNSPRIPELFRQSNTEEHVIAKAKLSLGDTISYQAISQSFGKTYVEVVTITRCE
jgi:hypothetical protein